MNRYLAIVALTMGQKFVYFVSICLIFAFGIGLLPLAILIYLELGSKDEDADEDTYER